eukprot:188646-Chlamydomonas_euryale.AAC.1
MPGCSSAAPPAEAMPGCTLNTGHPLLFCCGSWGENRARKLVHGAWGFAHVQHAENPGAMAA